MTATLSIIGLLEMDPTILNGITLPEGLDLDTLKNNIILECAELEVIYSAPSFFRWAVDCWAIKELPIWERMWNAIKTQYNPLENYNRTETTTETGSHSKTDSYTDETERAISNSGTTHSESEETTRGDHFVYGFNDNSQVKQSSDTGGTTSENDNTSSGTGSETGELNHSGSESGNNTLSRSSRVSGNIGVTTSQQMLSAELELDKKINMYDIIARDFRNRFCILMY